LIKLVGKHFNRTGTKNDIEDLLDLHQTSSIEEYIERLRFKLILNNQLFFETNFMDAFIGGLKSELKAFVKAYKPTTLKDGFEYALHMNSVLEIKFRKLNSTIELYNFQSLIKHPLSLPLLF
jgi:hypothetical protein